MINLCVVYVIKNYVEKESLVLDKSQCFKSYRLTKIELEEPYYYMNVDGERLYLDNALNILNNQSLFQEACMEQLRI